MPTMVRTLYFDGQASCPAHCLAFSGCLDVNAQRQPEITLAPKPEKLNYQAITTQAQLDELLKKLAMAQQIGLDTETTSLDPMSAQLVGISMAFAAGEAVYIPISHTFAEQQLNRETLLGSLKPYLESQSLHKIGQNLKYDQHVFANHGIQLQGVAGDAMLASYVLESHLGHGLDELAQRWLGLETITYESLCGKGAKQISFADVAVEQATDYACQDADFALRIEAHLKALMSDEQRKMYEEMESVFIALGNNLVPFFIEKSTLHKSDLLRVKFEEIETEADAEALLRHKVYLPLAVLPKLSGNKFYYHEVIGFQVEDVHYGVVGKIVGINDSTSQALFEIENENGNEILIPMADEFIEKIDRAHKKIIVKTPEGLIDLDVEN